MGDLNLEYIQNFYWFHWAGPGWTGLGRLKVQVRFQDRGGPTVFYQT